MFDTPEATFFFRAGVALALGMSVGLERERAAHEEKRPSFAGIRTFPICALTGFLCATMGGEALLLAGLVAVAGVTMTAYLRSTREGFFGVTSEAAYLATYLLGAGCARGLILESASIALAVTTLLAGKERLRGFAYALPDRDIAAALKFGVISIIILPGIPNRAFGESWWAVNFYKTWLMVVLISGIGFGGYILTRIVGPRTGTGLAGLVGGLVSSTAVTLSFSKRSREVPGLSAACSLAVVAACTVLWIRVFAEALVVNRAFAVALIPHLSILFVFSLAACYLLYRRAAAIPPTGETAPITFRNPVELRPAIKFAIAFTAVSIIFKIAQMHYGSTGTYVAGFLSGLTDMDAVTLSMANMTKQNLIGHREAITSVLLAAIANTLVKLGFAIALSSVAARKAIALALGSTCVVAVGVLIWTQMAR